MAMTVGNLRVFLTLDSSGYVKGLSAAGKEGKAFEREAGALAKSADPVGDAWGDVGKSITTDMKVAAGAVLAASAAGTAFGVSSIMVAARVEEMDGVLAQLGKTAGISKDAIDETVQSIKTQGITTQVAQGLTAQFIRNQLDLAHASDVARIAQDAAVLTQQNSSDTLADLNHYIQTGNSQLEVARALNLSTADANAKFAQEVGKSANELTEQEKMQARVNAVLEAGVPIQGAYDAAMDSSGKQMRSLSRYIEELQENVGEALLPAFSAIIGAAGDFLKGLRDLTAEGGNLRPIIETIGGILQEMVVPVILLAGGFISLLNAIPSGPMQIFASTLGVLARVLGIVGTAVVALIGFYKTYTLVTNTITFAKKVAAAVETTYNAVVKAGLALRNSEAVVLGWMVLTWAKETAAKIANTVATTAQTVAAKAAAAAQWLLNAALSANPIGLVVLAIAALVAGFILAYKYIKPFRDAVNSLWEAIKNVALAIWEWIQKIVGFFQWLYDKIFGNSIIPDLINGIIGSFARLFDSVSGVVRALSEGIVAVLTAMKELVLVIVDALGKGWLALFQLYIDLVFAILGVARDVIVAIWSFIRATVIAIVTALWAAVTGAFQVAVDWLISRITFWRDFFTGAWSTIRDTVVNIVSNLWDRVTGRFQQFIQWATDALTGWANTVERIMTGVRDAVANIMRQLGEKVGGAVNWVIDRINDFIGLVRDGLGKFGVEIPKDWKVENVSIPAMARGGLTAGPTLAGEAGRESVIPWSSKYRARAEEIWKLTGAALGFLAMGGPGGAQGHWWDGNFPMTQGPGGGFSHAGTNAWDYAMPNGTPIKMGLPGVVMPGPGGAYGVSIGVNLDSGGSLVLAHLQNGPLKTGRVDVGELIGHSDNTGFSTGPHMHFELRNTSLSPGPGGQEGGGFDLLSRIRGWSDDILTKFGGDEPEWMRGMLKGLIGGDVVGKVASFIGDKFRSAINSIKNFVGELLFGGDGGERATPAELHKWMDQLGFMPAGGYAWADKIVGRESGWRLGAVGPQWNGDGGSRGLWQIQPGAHPWADVAKLFDGLYNTSAANRIYSSQGPNAWSTNYDRGGYWPSGTGGWNRSGAGEIVINQQTFGRLLSVLERLDSGDRSGREIRLEQHIQQPAATAEEIADEIAWKLRFA